MNLDTALDELSWIPRPRILALRRLQIAFVRDLLTHYPRRYENRIEFPSFPHDETVGPVCLCGEVVKTRLMRFGGRKIFEAVVEESRAHALSQPLTCRWFNLHYIQKLIATGQRLIMFGRVKRKGPRLVIDHPEFEVIENDEEALIHFRRITPIYPATEGLSQRVLRGLIFQLLEQVDVSSADVPLPDSLGNGEGEDALRKIHFPESRQQLEKVRDHLVLAEFFRIQMQIVAARRENSARVGHCHQTPGILVEKFIAALPFALTRPQQQVFNEIKHDLQTMSPMNRLLQGDVGSGKTVVAIAAMLFAVESGSQAALMAPTQILAEQHYTVLRHWLDPLGIRIALRTAARQEDNTPLPLFARADEHSPKQARNVARSCTPQMPGAADPNNDTTPEIIVGTHALLYEDVTFSDLGLAVIDEQHKFGVAQRARLTTRSPAPDVLVMTATPIPRTLTMTLYGDLEVSTIDEIPMGRGQIITHLLGQDKLGEAITFLRQELNLGRQGYIIYPLVEESEKIEAKAAAKEFEQWQKRLTPFRCELLHGRVVSAEKQAIMQRFRAGETHVLISTTVIEVGVDIPNATVMLIENAERFGLSQLHQLRGRIGRGAHTSHCWLISSDKDPETMTKLAALEITTNGFEIAEADWELRGPGDLLGTAQSGLPALKLGDLRRDVVLMQKARRAALKLLENDPGLDQLENQHFRALIVERQGQTFSHVS